MIYNVDKGRKLLFLYLMPIVVGLPVTVGFLLKYYPDQETWILSLVPVFFVCLAAAIARIIRAKAQS